jgi:UDP-N-acetylmuramate--alanine ligase
MINQAKNIFFLGIKGVAMANLAIILQKMGKKVYGCDVKEEFLTDELLKKYKIKVFNGFNFLPKNVDLIIYSAAHQGLKNPLIEKGRKKGIKIISQPELIAEVMRDFKLKLAVCGCHGKTTTASLLAYCLIKLNQKPAYLVGAPSFNGYLGGDFLGEKKYFVVEADEYAVNPPDDTRPKFFFLDPDWIIATNIDYDHPDVYPNIEVTKKAFYKFFAGVNLILNIDNQYLDEFYQENKNLGQNKIISFGFSKKADYQITDWRLFFNRSQFTIKDLGEFSINLVGKHHVLNATAVIIQLLNLGFAVDEIKKAITGFFGAKRRMEKIFANRKITIIDDYAHHPNEIKATIEALKTKFKKRRLIIIFQPHTYSRTIALMDDFKKSLALADLVFLLPIFSSAREKQGAVKISAKELTEGSDRLFYMAEKKQLLEKLSQIIKKGDVIVTMGAGDVYRLADAIKKLAID